MARQEKYPIFGAPRKINRCSLQKSSRRHAGACMRSQQLVSHPRSPGSKPMKPLYTPWPAGDHFLLAATPRQPGKKITSSSLWMHITCNARRLWKASSWCTASQTTQYTGNGAGRYSRHFKSMGSSKMDRAIRLSTMSMRSRLRGETIWRVFGW